MQEKIQQLWVVANAVVESAPTAEPMRVEEENNDGEDVEEAAGRGSSSTKDLVPKQVHVPQVTVPVVPEFWAIGLSVCMARRGLPTSSRVLGKVPAMQAVPLPWVETDKKLAWWLKGERLQQRRHGWGEMLPP